MLFRLWIDELFEIALEGCGEEIYDIPLYVIVERILELDYDGIYCGDRYSDVVPHWDGVKECLKLTFYNKHGDYLVDHWLAPDGLIRLSERFLKQVVPFGPSPQS